MKKKFLIVGICIFFIFVLLNYVFKDELSINKTGLVNSYLGENEQNSNTDLIEINQGILVLDNTEYNLNSETENVLATEYTYTGGEITPMFDIKMVTGETETILDSEDYIITYENNINVSTEGNKAKIKITGNNAYTGEVEVYFNILPLSIKNCDLFIGGKKYSSNNLNTYAYTGTKIKPSVEIKEKVDNEYRTISQDNYDIEYKNYTNPGTATINLTGKNNLNESRKGTFTIFYKEYYSIDDYNYFGDDSIVEGYIISNEDGKIIVDKDLTITKDNQSFYNTIFNKPIKITGNKSKFINCTFESSVNIGENKGSDGVAEFSTFSECTFRGNVRVNGRFSNISYCDFTSENATEDTLKVVNNGMDGVFKNLNIIDSKANGILYNSYGCLFLNICIKNSESNGIKIQEGGGNFSDIFVQNNKENGVMVYSSKYDGNNELKEIIEIQINNLYALNNGSSSGNNYYGLYAEKAKYCYFGVKACENNIKLVDCENNSGEIDIKDNYDYIDSNEKKNDIKISKYTDNHNFNIDNQLSLNNYIANINDETYIKRKLYTEAEKEFNDNNCYISCCFEGNITINEEQSPRFIDCEFKGNVEVKGENTEFEFCYFNQKLNDLGINTKVYESVFYNSSKDGIYISETAEGGKYQNIIIRNSRENGLVYKGKNCEFTNISISSTKKEGIFIDNSNSGTFNNIKVFCCNNGQSEENNIVYAGLKIKDSSNIKLYNINTQQNYGIGLKLENTSNCDIKINSMANSWHFLNNSGAKPTSNLNDINQYYGIEIDSNCSDNTGIINICSSYANIKESNGNYSSGFDSSDKGYIDYSNNNDLSVMMTNYADCNLDKTYSYIWFGKYAPERNVKKYKDINLELSEDSSINSNLNNIKTLLYENESSEIVDKNIIEGDKNEVAATAEKIITDITSNKGYFILDAEHSNNYSFAYIKYELKDDTINNDFEQEKRYYTLSKEKNHDVLYFDIDQEVEDIESISLEIFIVNEDGTIPNESDIDIRADYFLYEDKISLDKNVIKDNEKINIQANISDIDVNSSYLMKVECENNIIEKPITELKNGFEIDLNLFEGKQNLKVSIYKDDEIYHEENFDLYYIKSYEKQFLDELSNKSTSVHFRNNADDTDDDYEKVFDMLKSMGMKNVRAAVYWSPYGNNFYGINNKYLAYCRNWMNSAKDNNINILTILNNNYKTNDTEKNVIYTDEDINSFVNFAKTFSDSENYPQIRGFEVINEPNYSGRYVTEDRIRAYAKLFKNVYTELKEENIDIITGGLGWDETITESNDRQMWPTDFYNLLNIYDCYKYADSYAVHTYRDIDAKLTEYSNTCNNSGGFIKKYVTEYGISSAKDIGKNDIDEEKQASELVKQTVKMDYYNIKFANINNFRNFKSSETQKVGGNYGLIHSDYTPKLSYYAIKNLLSNTNGAEYISKISINENIDAHVYDKDGKTIIVLWGKEDDEISLNINNLQSQEGTSIIVKDIYGNEINPDINNEIKIFSEPLYIENANKEYFYQAISENIIEKYNEFIEKYNIDETDEIRMIIENIKNNISGISNLTYEQAKELMENHYNIGNLIIDKYLNKTEYTELSSKLDMLDEIGNLYEDYITVSVQDERIDLENINSNIDRVESIIDNNEELNVIYPTKILQFGKNLYNVSNYIDNLDDENDIKNGLVLSKGLHAQMLSEWAEEFYETVINFDNTAPEITKLETTTNSIEIEATDEESGIVGYAVTETGTVPTDFTETEETDFIENTSTTEEQNTSVTETQNKKKLKVTKIGLKANTKYYVWVKDKAGNINELEENKTTIQTQIEEQTISSDIYHIEENCIENINVNTTISEFTENLIPSKEIKIYNKNDEEVQDGYIGTGYKVKVGDEEYTVSVKGDLNSDGITDIGDLSTISAHIVEIGELKNEYYSAGDLNNDSDVDLSDLSIMAYYISIE